MAEIQTVANYINGEWEAPASGKYLDNPNPATNKVFSRIPHSEQADVDKAVAAAKEAYKTWRKTTNKERSDLLNKIADALEAQLETLAKLESTDTGKPYSLAKSVDIPRAVSNFRFFAGAVLHQKTEAYAMHDGLNYSLRTPVGVAGLVTPWNLPLYLLSWKVAPCLAAGNTIVAKPSEVTPMTANALAEIMHQCGVPKGVFNICHGLGASAGGPIVSHPDVSLVSFTGGTATGKIVGRMAGDTFKKTSLELGGKNATIVFDDCDWDITIPGAVRASFANQGQVCLCGSRLVVHEKIYDKFVKAYVEEVKKLTPGDPATSNFGSLVSQQHRDKVESYVALAKEEGGTILCGGVRPDLPAPYNEGAFFMPTVVAGLGPDSRCAMEEVFGPFVTVHKFSTEEEALAIANCTQYGLAGSLWTSNLSRAHRMMTEWETGMIWINCWLYRDLRVPFGGVKASGVGSPEGGDYCWEFWTNMKNVCVKYA